MNEPLTSSRNPIACNEPHHRQAQTWTRFAQILRTVRAHAHRRREEALAWCLQKKTRGFAIPVQVNRTAGFSFGWNQLTRVMTQVRYPELEPKGFYDPETDTDGVVLYVHYATKGGSCKAPIGHLPDFDAKWMVPLLEEDLARWMNLFVVRQEADTAEIAIAGSWVAAHHWIDHYDERRSWTIERPTSEKEKAVAAYLQAGHASNISEDVRREITDLQNRINTTLLEINAREEVGLPTTRLNAYVASLSGQIEYLNLRARQADSTHLDEPTVEDGVRKDVGLREVVFSDLEGTDFWGLPL